MTDAEAEQAHEIYLELDKAIAKLVQERLKKEKKEVAEQVRVLLTDYVRFWGP